MLWLLLLLFSQHNKHKLRAVIFHVQQHIINLFLSYSDRFYFTLFRHIHCWYHAAVSTVVPKRDNAENLYHLVSAVSSFKPYLIILLLVLFQIISRKLSPPYSTRHEKEIYNHDQSDVSATTLAMWKRHAGRRRRMKSF